MHYPKTIFAALLMLLVGLVHAQDALTRDDVERWLSAMKEIQEWGERQDADEVDIPDDVEVAGPQDFERLLAESTRQHREMQNILERHGFEDGEVWAETGSRVFQAFIALQMREMAPQMQAELEQALQQIDNNPHMDEQQKKMMRDQIKMSMDYQQRQLEAVPDGDMRAVEAMKGELETYFDQ